MEIVIENKEKENQGRGGEGVRNREE